MESLPESNSAAVSRPGFPENVPAEAKPCRVLLDGTWVDGFLLEWRRGSDGRWKGLVNYRDMAIRRTALRDQAELKPAEAGPAGLKPS